ncbi:hypothetical protein T484DRAFT_1981826 [Baffinella frigidus]|nr:hypothetical protein T484DRAFT_1981826 [Cryptophyta sp. CCMP2293]
MKQWDAFRLLALLSRVVSCHPAPISPPSPGSFSPRECRASFIVVAPRAPILALSEHTKTHKRVQLEEGEQLLGIGQPATPKVGDVPCPSPSPPTSPSRVHRATH